MGDSKRKAMCVLLPVIGSDTAQDAKGIYWRGFADNAVYDGCWVMTDQELATLGFKPPLTARRGVYDSGRERITLLGGAKAPASKLVVVNDNKAPHAAKLPRAVVRLQALSGTSIHILPAR